MTDYLRFASGEGDAADVLVEVDAAEVCPWRASRMPGCASGRGIRLVRRSWWPKSGLEQAVRRAVSVNVRAFLAAAEALEEPPAEMEITFGLKATGEVGNLAVGKIAGESNYQVKMVWRRPAEK